MSACLAGPVCRAYAAAAGALRSAKVLRWQGGLRQRQRLVRSCTSTTLPCTAGPEAVACRCCGDTPTKTAVRAACLPKGLRHDDPPDRADAPFQSPGILDPGILDRCPTAAAFSSPNRPRSRQPTKPCTQIATDPPIPRTLGATCHHSDWPPCGGMVIGLGVACATHLTTRSLRSRATLLGPLNRKVGRLAS
jgi:hypothetical protein